jgi:hypothetical protein
MEERQRPDRRDERDDEEDSEDPSMPLILIHRSSFDRPLPVSA